MRNSLLSLAILGLLLAACAPAADTPDLTEPEPFAPLPSGPQGAPLDCADAPPAFVPDLQVYQTPALDEPPARQPFRDPVFGTCLVRATDRRADLAAGDNSAGLKNEYSRVQSYNADGTRLLARSTAATWYVYDALSLQPLGRVPLDTDPRWSATDPNVIYYSSDTRLMSFDIGSGMQAVVHDFSVEFPGSAMVWTRYEGGPSADGRYWGLMAEDIDWLTSYFIIYDLQTDTVIASLDLRGWPDEAREIDSVTISPLGNYFLAQMDRYCAPGQPGSEDYPCGLMVYDRSLQNGRGLLRIVGHSDTALDAAGREVFVYQDIDSDEIAMLDLESGERTALWPIDFSHTPLGLHISGRAYNLPGWALVSTHDGDPLSYTWMDDVVFAMELKPGGRIVRLAHTRSLVDESMEQDYWAEPQASVNPDFTRVLFTTNWGRSGTEQIEMMAVLLPAGWSTKLP